MGKGARSDPKKMLKSAKRWLTAIGLSTALLLSSPIGLANKAYAAKKQQQTQQTQRISVHGIDIEKYAERYRLQHEIKLLYDYLDLNKEFLKREKEGLDTKKVCAKRKSLEERVEKILNKQLTSMLFEMYPMQNEQYERKLDVDLVDAPSFIVITDRNGKTLYEETFSKAFSRNTLEKLEDLAEFLGPDSVKELGNGFIRRMSDEGIVRRINDLIAQAKKDNNGKLKRKYRAYANYLGGYVYQWFNKVYISSRTYRLSFMMLTCGHEYGHILHTGFPVSMKYAGEQKTLQETICDLLGDETSSRYAQKYLQKDQKRYARYMYGIMRKEINARMWKGLIKKVDKLLAEGEIDKAEWVMNEAASISNISEINQASLAIARLYYSHNGEKEEGNRSKLDSMLKELNPDYFIETTKYVTNFNEVDYACSLIEDINKMDKNELKQSYLENQQTIRELKEKESAKADSSTMDFKPMMRALGFKLIPPSVGGKFIPRTWELRKEFVKKSLLEYELYERLPENEAAEIIEETKKEIIEKETIKKKYW